LASDCLNIIQCILAEERDRSIVGAVVADIKKLAIEFANISFKRVGRELNIPAHLLAHSSEHNIYKLSISVISGVHPKHTTL
jgi:hypothetical protein